MTATKRSQPHPRRSDATKLSRAVRLIAEGMSEADAAKKVGVHRTTVHRWRATAAGAEAMEKARADVERAFQSTVEQARTRLMHGALKATERHLQILEAGEDADALRAIAMLYDRAGLPAKGLAEVTLAPALDLAKLSPEEFEQLRRLSAKSRPEG